MIIQKIRRCLSGFSSIDRYSAQDHSLLRQIYTYPYYDHYLGYLLVDHKSKSILAIDPGDYQTALSNVALLQQQLGYNFTHVLQTHGNSHHSASTRALHTKFEGLNAFAADAGEETISFYTHLAKDLVPIIVGDLSICFIATPGHTKDSYTITHISNDSTQIPVLFTGDTLLVCSIGEVEDYKAFNDSLQRLRGFPAETLIFPGHRLRKENLLFSKTLDPSNPALNIKMQILQDALDRNQNITMVPSSLMEERLINPYLRCSNDAIQKVVQERNPVQYIKKLKHIQNSYFI